MRSNIYSQSIQTINSSHYMEKRERSNDTQNSRAPFAVLMRCGSFFFSSPPFLHDKAGNVCTILESCLSFVRMFGSSYVVMVAVSNKLGYLTIVLRVETLTGIPLSDIYRRCVSRCQDVAVLIDFYREKKINNFDRSQRLGGIPIFPRSVFVFRLLGVQV